MERETVFQHFLQLAGLSGEQGEAWRFLCEAACDQLEGRLREDADPKDGRLALAAAAVFYYLFNYLVAFAMQRIEKALDYYR